MRGRENKVLLLLLLDWAAAAAPEVTRQEIQNPYFSFFEHLKLKRNETIKMDSFASAKSTRKSPTIEIEISFRN